jgi:polar amino acid transport system substrate-binding protein
MASVSREVLAELAPNGVLRVAINLGNPVLAQRAPDGSEPRGASVDLARELGRRLGVAVRLVPFDSAGQVIDALPAGHLDLVFLAVDPVRAAGVLFTRPWMILAATCLVRQDSSVRTLADLDRPGTRIAVGRGAAYDLFLSRTLQFAQLVRAATSAEAIERFATDGLEAAAGVQQPLLEYALAHPGVRVLDAPFQVIEQALGVPAGRPLAKAYLEGFVEAMKTAGSATSAAPP